MLPDKLNIKASDSLIIHKWSNTASVARECKIETYYKRKSVFLYFEYCSFLPFVCRIDGEYRGDQELQYCCVFLLILTQILYFVVFLLNTFNLLTCVHSQGMFHHSTSCHFGAMNCTEWQTPQFDFSLSKFWFTLHTEDELHNRAVYD